MQAKPAAHDEPPTDEERRSAHSADITGQYNAWAIEPRYEETIVIGESDE